LCESTNTWVLQGDGTGGMSNPMTTLGDIIYGASSGTATRLAGNTTTTPQALISTGSAGAATAPAWSSVANYVVVWNMLTAGVSASSTQYSGPGASAWTSTEANRDWVSPIGGTIRNLYAITGSTQSGTGSLVCTIRKNAADTSVTFTIAASGAATTYSDTSNTASVAAGDKLNFKCVNNATATSAQFITVSFLVTP
jgi:hypothetical protein